MSEQKQDHPRQDIIEFLCGAGTYDSLWWHDTPKDKRPTYWWRSKLRDHNTDLLAKVSEQSQRIQELTKENERLQNNYDELRKFFLKNSDEHIDALDKIKALTEQVEKLKAEAKFFQRDFEQIPKLQAELSRLREERKELVEALREIVISYGSQHPWRKESIDKAESLLNNQPDEKH